MITQQPIAIRKFKPPRALELWALSPRLGRIRFLGLLSFSLVMIGIPILIKYEVENLDEFANQIILNKYINFFSMFNMWAIMANIICLFIRRLHDIGRSGWWLLMNIIPGVGFVIILYLSARSGTKHENKFGPVPQKPTKVDYVFIMSTPLLMLLVQILIFLS